MSGHIFWEFWRVFKNTSNLWANPFKVNDPVNTPRDVNVADAAVVASIKSSLAAATETLVNAGIALDAEWGDIQYVEKNGVRYGIHGRDVSMMFSAIVSPLVPGRGYSAISAGNSYIQAVIWDHQKCPDAYDALTYSQSTNPHSPCFADATRHCSRSKWIDLPFCRRDVREERVERMTLRE